MASIFTDSCGDYYGATGTAVAWTNANGTTADVSGANSRTGIGAIECTSSCPQQTIPNGTHYFAGIAFKQTGFPGGNSGSKPLGFAYNNGYPFQSVFIQTNGAAGIDLVGGLGIAASSAPGVLTAGLYAYVELGIAITGNTCLASVRLNGFEIIPPTSLALGFGATSVNVFCPGIFGPSGINMWLDDAYVNDNTGTLNNSFAGPVRIYYTVPNADLTPLQWTPSTGSAHFSLVNQVPPNGGAEYVSSQTPNQVDQYAFPLPAGMGSVRILAAGVRLLSEIDSSGARSLGSQIGATPSAGLPLTTAYNIARYQYDTNPITGLPFATSDFPLPCGPVVTA